MSNYIKPKPNFLNAALAGKVLFIDIETVPAYETFHELPEVFKDLWRDKAERMKERETYSAEELYFMKSGVFAEFAKVICICIGAIHNDKGTMRFRVKSFAGDNEHDVLHDFKQLLDAKYNDLSNQYMCAHNGIEFDYPFTARRMVINGIELPAMLNIGGTKSWNNPFLLDTLEHWKFGDMKGTISLNLMAACLNVPSPKDDISGKDVAKVYYKEKDLDRIVTYCCKDVLTIGRIFLKLFQGGTIEDENVELL